MKTVGVIGAGSWGTALATVLAGKGHKVRIFDVDEKHLKSMEENRENVDYLPGVPLNENISFAYTNREAVEGADAVLFSAPAQHFRSALDSTLPYMKKDVLIINVAKGIEQGTHKRMSEIAAEVFAEAGTDDAMDRYVVLSGPSHAEEVGRRMPTTVATASQNRSSAEAAQDLFMTDRFRVYTSDDVIGVELGGALKNIIALGAGISDGMGFGDNAKAALITRGLAEITRLGIKLGARRETFAGLAGTGDLIVTCTSMHSRNRRCGIMMGEGMDPQEAVKKVGMVVEGMFTAEAAYELAKIAEVEMPITDAIYNITTGKLKASDALTALMGREKRHELDHAE
ncbi:MAG: NAD(P)H-dependent glycerol-3-phosphate dehydrogenase [Clostridiales bacterium]|nr:NAD(P)H-dependent glycerol-3-phosphate dehydrogenase [Clostridiales bacterium]MDD7036143.1 NAD(P)H-dependent glycerol-3-phosphate dehydrogenase [Bacillota bacterium]MDY2921197.1 NAD(P)H-dependent glycerol-3-phosphate dehydrogenase [Lentihominibacter sp.]